ncbi:MAG: shikimate kinase [Parachlamydiaceae bacterium]|nr:shikimate kinase [Parachlamydiaceae bacterium]
MNSIILCGLPGSGKTTIGRRLAERLNCDFRDTDDLIERHYLLLAGEHKSCREITKSEGEMLFCELESTIIKLFLQPTNQVIATGGGTLLNPLNTHHLKSLGRCVYLKASTSTVLPRILQTGMPTYLAPKTPETSLQQLAAVRDPIYASAADITIDANHTSVEAIVEELIQRLHHGK